MQSDRNRYIAAVLAIALFGAGYYLLKDFFTEWSFNLDKEKKNAYGTFLTYELIRSRFASAGFSEINKNVREKLRTLDKHKTYNYIFINNVPYYDSATVDTLCRFAEAGSTVFICAEQLHGALKDSVLNKTYHLKLRSDIRMRNELSDSNYQLKKFSRFNFYHPSLHTREGYSYYLKYRSDTVMHFFNSFAVVPDSDQTALIPKGNEIWFAGLEASNDTAPNFAVLRHGKGQFILLLSAVPFTNYFMRQAYGLEYAEKVFSHLPQQTTIWDDISHTISFDNSLEDRGDSSSGDTPLYFILKHRELRWAWYLTLLGILTYAGFHAKRRQRIIPLLTPKQNTSLQYVDTIGQLYYHETEHGEIAAEMRTQFLNYVRRKYHIILHEDEGAIRQLALKSGIETEKISSIFLIFNDIIKVRSFDKEKLRNLNQQLEYFYENSK
jgi:hypothetical protein